MGHSPMRRTRGFGELFHLRAEFREASAPTLQVDEGRLIGVTVQQAGTVSIIH